MKYRHEWKHEITAFDVLCLRRRLSAVMQPDPHASNGRYLVRSLYFDDLRDQALQDKLNGVSRPGKSSASAAITATTPTWYWRKRASWAACVPRSRPGSPGPRRRLCCRGTRRPCRTAPTRWCRSSAAKCAPGACAPRPLWTIPGSPLCSHPAMSG